jgi:hypothetical protein
MKIVSDNPSLLPRWPLLLKIEFSLNDNYFFNINPNELKIKPQLHVIE